MSGADPTPTSPQTAEDVIAEVAERNIRFIRLWFTDVLGQLKSFSINSAELEDAFAGGNGFDGSSITGFNPVEESDMLAVPDPTTFTTLPWSPEEQPTGRMFCDIRVPGGDALRGRSPLDPPAGRSSGPTTWASTPSTSVPSSSSSTSATPGPTAASPRCSTRAATST